MHGDELGPGVPVEADEEQAGIQVAETIGAVGEVVAPAQDPGALQLFLRRQSDVCVLRDQWDAAGTAHVQVRLVELRYLAQWGALPLSLPMIASWSNSGVRSQISMCMRILRATR